jgi:hypothetical protein
MLYKKTVVKTNAENVALKKPPNKNVNLFSTLDKTKITKPQVETDCHYYMVKEVIINLDGITIINEKEYAFKHGKMDNNKIESRLFYDNKIEEILVSKIAEDKKIKLELYLIRHSNLVQGKKYILIDSNGVENIEN